jgi:hypothetical protein
MKFSGDTNEDHIIKCREVELLNQLQMDLKNLQLTNQANSKADDDDVEIADIEIIDVPIKKSSPDTSIYYVSDENETNDESLTNIVNDIPFISHEKIITGKLIDNAIKTEKTFMKYFDENLNPYLQPNSW